MNDLTFSPNPSKRRKTSNPKNDRKGEEKKSNTHQNTQADCCLYILFFPLRMNVEPEEFKQSVVNGTTLGISWFVETV